MSGLYIGLERNAGRFPSITEKISRERTSLNGSLFVHVSINPANGAIHEITFSEKAKDGSTLDNLLGALGDAVTGIMHELGAVIDPPGASAKHLDVTIPPTGEQHGEG